MYRSPSRSVGVLLAASGVHVWVHARGGGAGGGQGMVWGGGGEPQSKLSLSSIVEVVSDLAAESGANGSIEGGGGGGGAWGREGVLSYQAAGRGWQRLVGSRSWRQKEC